VARFSQEKSILANALGQNDTNYVRAPASVLALTEAYTNTAAGFGSRAVFAASKS
jgi:hypothetical protein